MTIKEFIRECHEREVFKMLSIYVVTSWVILQVLSVTWQPLGFPETSVTYLILILIIGLPIYIFYIWRSRLKHQVSNDPDDAVEVKNRRVFERFFFTGFGIISFFCAMSILLIVNNSFGNNNALPEFSSVDRIAVLQFENDTGNEKFDFVSKMSADWITHGITDSKVGQVITSEIINEYTEMARSSSAGLSGIDILKSYLKPAKIISGSIFLNGDDLIFRCSVLDGTTNEVLISLNPVNCPTGRPLDCIEEIRQRILGYLSFVDKPELNLQKNPPTFESYQYLMEAKELGAFDSIYPVLLDKAIQADSTNWEALAFKVMYYYNIDDYKKADSLRKAILPKSGLSDRQRNLMNHFNALFIGNNWNAYAYHLEEYKLAPFDFITNRSQMVLALQYI
ncbi:MAG: hypothetical protein KJN68_01310, partial [Bacteroidia bacterium]|nr:hypothetical protein [Bacteroidia bacterium]